MISRLDKGRALRLWAGPEGVPGLLREGGQGVVLGLWMVLLWNLEFIFLFF